MWRVAGRESGSPELLESPRTSPEVSRTSPEVFGDFPGSSLTVELNSNPEVPRKFPRLPRKFPGLPRKFPGLPRRSAVSLGSLTRSSDSQKLSLNPTPATCHQRKRKLRCSFRSAALQKLHCNIGFSAMRKSFGPKTALQQTKNCTATSRKLRCRKVWRFPAAFLRVSRPHV